MNYLREKGKYKVRVEKKQLTQNLCMSWYQISSLFTPNPIKKHSPDAELEHLKFFS